MSHTCDEACTCDCEQCERTRPHDDEPMPERTTMTDPKLHELLDQTQFGDVLTLAHSNGKHTASISGPVLTDQTHDPAVGIHLLDGQPHVVRNSTGVIWAPVVQAILHRGGELIAEWDAADHLEAPQGDSEPWTPDTAHVEFCFMGEGLDGGERFEAFYRWLDSIRAEAWDEAVHTLWDEAIDILSRPWGDMIPAQIADLDRRNPYRKEQS